MRVGNLDIDLILFDIFPFFLFQIKEDIKC